MSITISCTFERTYMEGAKLLFSVRPYKVREDLGDIVQNNGTIMCEGVVQPYIKNTPLILTIEQTKPAQVLNCLEFVKDEEEAVLFLSSGLVKGIGKANAKRIIAITGKNIFAFAQKTDAVQTLTDNRITDEMAHALISTIRGIVFQRRFTEYLAKKGCSCTSASSFYKMYRSDSMDKLKKNPYLLRYADVPFSAYDSIGMSFGYAYDDAKRMDAVLYEIMKRNVGMGNTYITFNDICTMSNRMAGDLHPFLMAAAIARNRDKYDCISKNEEYRVYRTEELSLEEKAADNIVRLLGASVPLNTEGLEEYISGMEEGSGIKYAKEQKDAFHLLEKSGICILTGGPGTGKTTVLNGILKFYEKRHPYKTMALAAPTAAAAKRMKEATGRTAQTVHKLLDIRPTGYGGYTSRNEYDQLPFDLIVIDESSMLDLELFTMLITAVKNGALLLLLGDKDQLSSVGAGNVLHDLMEIPEVRNVHLMSIFRQDESSSIVKNSIAIRDGMYWQIEEDDMTERIFCKTEEEMKEKALQLMKKYYDIEHPEKVRLFATARNRKFAISTERLNAELQQIFNSDEKDFLVSGAERFMAGDPVVFQRNNYETGYYNGDEGVVVDIEKTIGGHRKLIIYTDTTLEISGKDLQDVSLAYATTVHKSQGSECEIAIILLPAKPASLLRKDLLYVAATRAKKKNIFIIEETASGWTNNAMEEACKNTRAPERRSGLIDKVRERLTR